ncbi:MAG: hypothetical protein ACR2HR_05085 [Euzebya sp.]
MVGRTDVVVAFLVIVIGLAGIAQVLLSDAHDDHDPVHGLQQLDLLYLDQPAPLAGELGFTTSGPTLLVVCQDCSAPSVSVTTTVTNDPEVAAAYGLRRADGSVGPGYALIDRSGVLRYRTFDPGLSQHAREIDILVAGLP